MPFVLQISRLALLLNPDAGVRAAETPPPGPPLLAPVVGGSRVGRATIADHASADEPRLRRALDGSGDLLYDASGFSARIAPDGRVAFHDNHIGVINLLAWLPTPAPRNVPSVQSTIGGLLRAETAPFSDHKQPNDSSFLVIPLSTSFRPDPREACRACALPPDLLPANVTGRFDLTDELMRLSSQDPHRDEKPLDSHFGPTDADDVCPSPP